MIRLSSKAIGFVEDAILELPEAEQRAKALWRDQVHDDQLGPDVAKVALMALQNAEKSFKLQLEHGFLGEDEAADVINDIEFIRAIESDLERDLGMPSAGVMA
jgi:hypothetical protein